MFVISSVLGAITALFLSATEGLLRHSSPTHLFSSHDSGSDERGLAAQVPRFACGANSVFLFARLVTPETAISLEEVQSVLPTNRPTSLLDLKACLLKFGIQARAYNGHAKCFWRHRQKPLIVHLHPTNDGQPNIGHFLVVYDYDPAADRALYIDATTAEFGAVNSGWLAKRTSGYYIASARWKYSSVVNVSANAIVGVALGVTCLLIGGFLFKKGVGWQLVGAQRAHESRLLKQ